MPNTNYTTHVSDMTCAASALNLVIEKLWDEERAGEAFVLERIRDTFNEGTGAFDELIYAIDKQRGES